MDASSYGEGLASHTGPESCVGSRKVAGEALTGVPREPVMASGAANQTVRAVASANLAKAGLAPGWGNGCNSLESRPWRRNGGRAAFALNSPPMNRSPAPAVPFTVVVPTVYGQMMVNRHDVNQTGALFKTGRAIDHDEIAMLARMLPSLGTGLTVLDVGANFGTYSIALSAVAGPAGKVHAFEPQRLIYNLLVGSVALNALTNVYCHNVALGDREGRVEIPQYDYDRPMNFGSIEFGGTQQEALPQAAGHDPSRAEFVTLMTVDRFEFPQVHLMKVDVEGMELQVLRGAAETVRRCRPLLFVEHLKNDREALRRAIAEMDYVVYQKEKGINFLCVPTEMKDRIVP